MDHYYIATTRSGKITKGTINAKSRAAVADQLRAKNLLVISIDEKKSGLGAVSNAMVKGVRFSRVTLLDKVILARHLALMMRSGLALDEALGVIGEQTSSKKLQMILADVRKSVSNGGSLTSGLSKYPKVFSGLFTGMIQVGESSGSLERNLEYVASTLEKDFALRRKVMAALIYPIIILVATFFVAIAMVFFVLPRIVRMFESLRMTLPVATRVFLSLAKFLVADGLYVLIGIIGLVILIRALVVAKATKPFFHRLNLRLPFLKKLIKNVNLARITRILAVLMKSGVTINEGLTMTAQAINNLVYRKMLLAAVESVKKGKSLADAFSDEKYIPKMTNRMISVGEKTGHLEDNLFYLADFYEAEVEQSTKNLSSIIGPVLMIIIGIVLGLLAIAIISPIYQFSGSLGR